MKKIVCPHCRYEFKSTNAVIRPSKKIYKWYEFTESHSFCPSCDKRYQADITVLGATLFLIYIALVFVVGFFLEADYRLFLLVLPILISFLFRKRIFKIEAKFK